MSEVRRLWRGMKSVRRAMRGARRLVGAVSGVLLALAVVAACADIARISRSSAAPSPTVRPGLGSENPTAPLPKAGRHDNRPYHYRRLPPPPPAPPRGPRPRTSDAETGDRQHTDARLEHRLSGRSDGSWPTEEDPGGCDER